MGKYISKQIEVEAREITKVARMECGDYLYAFEAGGDLLADVLLDEQCGMHMPSEGDCVILGENGDTYLCPAEVFKKKYEPATIKFSRPTPYPIGNGGAPTISADAIDKKIAGVRFVRMPDTTLTICVLILENGFTVTGESACVCAENFDEALGRDIAFKKAKEKVWQLEGYLLAQRLHEASQ